MKLSSTKSKGISAIASIMMIIVGVTGIVLVVTYWKKENVTEVQGRFGIVVDAGGSGTRLSVYEYSTTKKSMNEIKYIKCENKGLSEYGENTTEIKTFLQQCFDVAEKEIPLEVRAETPLYMGATAGMRILRETNHTVYDSIWSTVRSILRNGSFPVRLARTLNGTEEGGYSWTTVNSLLEHSIKDSSGLYEVGSSSMQIAFQPHSAMSHVPTEYKQTVVLNEQKYDVYAHSFLCFGKLEFVRRYKARLIKNSNYSLTIEDPCVFKGYRGNVTSSYLFQEPCVAGDYAREVFGESIVGKSDEWYTIVGASNFTKCYQVVTSMFNTSNCERNCSVNGVYQPEYNGSFTAIGGGFYHSAIFANISSPTTLKKYKEGAEMLCGKNFSEIQQMVGYSTYADSYCLDAVSNYFTLRNILKVGDDVEITHADTIKEKRLTWALGLMLSHVYEMTASVLKKTKDLADSPFYALIVIFSLIMFIGLCVLLVIVFRKKQRVMHSTH